MIFKSKLPLIDIFVLVALLAGISLTIWGLVHLPWPGALPWSGLDAFSQFLGYLSGSAVTVVSVIFWSGRNPLAVAGAAIVFLALMAGSLWPLLVTFWFGIASTVLGKSILSCFFIYDDERVLTNFLVGAGFYGTAVGLLAHFPINYPGVYALALALPLLIWWPKVLEYFGLLRALLNQTEKSDLKSIWLDSAIIVVAMVHFVVALMPEVGHDALAMHLFIPASMASLQRWGFDADTYVWAVMPMLGDWIFTVGYMLAGETAARLINLSFIFVIAWLVRDLVMWAGGGVMGSRWAALLFLSTPLTFTESSALFIESVWAAFVVAGTLAFLQVRESSDKYKSWIALTALFLGFSVATKAVTLTILPVFVLLVLWNYKILLKKISMPAWLVATGLFLIVGLIPYLTAWYLTGNPVFPFFNGIFGSRYYPSVNFDSAAIFGKGLTWDVLYRATFDSGKYLEAKGGAAGFQWLLLFVPASVIVLGAKQRRGATLLLFGTSVVVVVFHSVSYFRYAFPAWAILAAVMGITLDSNVSSVGKFTKICCATAAAITVLINLLFLNAGAQIGDFPLKSIWNEESRDTYLKDRLPIRKAVSLVNHLNLGRSPVAVFAQPLTAGIESDVLYSNWYNFRFQGEINASNNVGDITNLLLRRGVEFVIFDSNWTGGPEKRELINNATEVIAQYGSISVRRIRNDFLFKTEVLKNSDFSSIDGWSLMPGTEYDTETGVLTVNVTSPASQAFAVSKGQRYRNTVVARCTKEASLGRIQINWNDAKGQFIKADIKTFDCMLDWNEETMEVVAPPAATVGIVYVSGHTATPLQFKSNSLRK